VARQEQAMGRTKLDSVELADRAPSSHVARTDQERFGNIFRRNMPYGTASDHGTMFVGFSAAQRRLHFVPSTQGIRRFASAGDTG
jgi:putative iron-dependent peroxidase